MVKGERQPSLTLSMMSSASSSQVVPKHKEKCATILYKDIHTQTYTNTQRHACTLRSIDIKQMKCLKILFPSHNRTSLTLTRLRVIFGTTFGCYFANLYTQGVILSNVEFLI